MCIKYCSFFLLRIINGDEVCSLHSHRHGLKPLFTLLPLRNSATDEYFVLYRLHMKIWIWNTSNSEHSSHFMLGCLTPTYHGPCREGFNASASSPCLCRGIQTRINSSQWRPDVCGWGIKGTANQERNETNGIHSNADDNDPPPDPPGCGYVTICEASKTQSAIESESNGHHSS